MGLRIINSRADERNPNSGRCPLALRRICGVCRHFQGAHIRAVGRCGRFGVSDLRGPSSAARCEDWERRTVAPGQKAVVDPLPVPVSASRAAQGRRQPGAVSLQRRLEMYPKLAKQGLTLPQAAKRLKVCRATIVRDLGARGLSWTGLRGDARPVAVTTMAAVIRAVSTVYGVSEAELLGRSRQGYVCEARAVAFALAVDLVGMSLSEVGRYFDGRDPNTVGPVVRRARARMDGDAPQRARNMALSLAHGSGERGAA